MSAPRRRVITAREVETAAYSGAKELAFDEQSSIVTPLARERANDLGVALRASGGREPLGELRPELAAEVLRRVQRRLEQP